MASNLWVSSLKLWRRSSVTVSRKSLTSPTTIVTMNSCLHACFKKSREDWKHSVQVLTAFAIAGWLAAKLTARVSYNAIPRMNPLCSPNYTARRTPEIEDLTLCFGDAVAHSLNRPNAIMTTQGGNRAHMRKCEAARRWK